MFTSKWDVRNYEIVICQGGDRSKESNFDAHLAISKISAASRNFTYRKVIESHHVQIISFNWQRNVLSICQQNQNWRLTTIYRRVRCYFFNEFIRMGGGQRLKNPKVLPELMGEMTPWSPCVCQTNNHGVFRLFPYSIEIQHHLRSIWMVSSNIDIQFC